MYALDSGLTFDPTDLTEALTPAAFHQALAGRAFVRALLIALRLNDTTLLKHGLMSVPPGQLNTVAAQLPAMFMQQILTSLVECLEESPHMEFLLSWLKALLVAHGPTLAAAANGGTVLKAAVVAGGVGAAAAASAAGGGGVTAALRALQQVVTRLQKDLSSTAEGNVYLLDYIISAGKLHEQQQQHEGEQMDVEEQQDGQQAATTEPPAVTQAVSKPSGRGRSAADVAGAKKAGKSKK